MQLRGLIIHKLWEDKGIMQELKEALADMPITKKGPLNRTYRSRSEDVVKALKEISLPVKYSKLNTRRQYLELKQEKSQIKLD